MAEAVVEDPATVGEKNPAKSVHEDAFHNFIQGKRHLLVQDYSHAVQSLASACELYTEHFGEMAPECGEVFFNYGKALFRLFQQQAGIFGDSVPDGGSNDDENDTPGSEEEKEDDNEEGEEDKEAGEENENEDNSNDTKEDDSESVSSSKDGEKAEPVEAVPASEPMEKEPVAKESSSGDNAPSSTVDETSATSNSLCKTTKESPSNENNDLSEAGPSHGKQTKSEEEISDMQLAWEALETAKSIFQKIGEDKKKEAHLKVAEILLMLGEISLECDNYEAAIKDLKEGLTIWQENLSSDDRRIAETLYQLGLAYQLNSESDKALNLYQSTIDVIMLRISILKGKTVIEQNQDGFDIDPNVEIAELEALLPDIKTKMEDAKDLEKDTKRAIQEMAFAKIEEVSMVSSTTEEKPAANISHLLKRKKPEDQDNAKTEEVKKIKLSSPTTNNEEKQLPTTSESTSPRIA